MKKALLVFMLSSFCFGIKINYPVIVVDKLLKDNGIPIIGVSKDRDGTLRVDFDDAATSLQKAQAATLILNYVYVPDDPNIKNRADFLATEGWTLQKQVLALVLNTQGDNALLNKLLVDVVRAKNKYP